MQYGICKTKREKELIHLIERKREHLFLERQDTSNSDELNCFEITCDEVMIFSISCKESTDHVM